MKLMSLIIYVSLRIYKGATKISHNITWKNKIKKLIKTKGAKKLTKTQTKEIRSHYRPYGIKDVSTQWHRFYFNCTGVFSPKYVPENIFYIDIEPSLNRSVYFPSLTDKNILDRRFPNMKQPETVIKNINDCYYANDDLIDEQKALTLCGTGDRLVIKPTIDSGGGRNILLFHSTNGVVDNGQKLKDVFRSYGKDFIVQKIVRQHPQLKALNATSLNTIRVMSYFDGYKVIILSAIVRIGRKGSSTDNATTGGISCGIQNNGQFNALGYQLSGECFQATDSGVKFKDVKLPFMPKINDAVIGLHKEAPFFKLISWDLAIDDLEHIVLIEYNVMGQGINSHQLNNGPVLSPLLQVLKG